MSAKLAERLDALEVELAAAREELRLEAAVERVRARAMGMGSTDDLPDVLFTLFDEYMGLDLGVLRVGLTFMDDSGRLEPWIAAEGRDGERTLHKGTFTKDDIDLGEVAFEAWKEQSWFCVLESDEFIQFIRGVYGQTFDRVLETVKSPEQYLFGAMHRYGMLHAVAPDPVGADSASGRALRRFATAFELAYGRYLDIRRAEDAAREARIEAALERIRGQAMAMRESNDLLDIVVTMRSAFVALGHEAHYFWHMRWMRDTYHKAMTSGDGTRIGMVMDLPRGFHDVPAMTAWERNDEPVGIFRFDTDGAIDYVHRMIELGRFHEIDPNAPTDDDIRHIGGLTFVMARTTHGEIGYSLPGVTEPPPEATAVLERFAGAFDLAYRRFEDLTQAEAQAREAQVELALERVRAHAMAMRQSDELADTIGVLFEQLTALGVHALNTYLVLYDLENDAFSIRMTGKDGNTAYAETTASFSDMPQFRSARESWEAGEPIIRIHYPPDRVGEWLALFQLHNEKLPPGARLDAGDFPDGVYNTSGRHAHGSLGITSNRPATPEEEELLGRFSREFERAYQRFRDLEAAEKAAREARIETALERVRSRALAMQTSDELHDVAVELRAQMNALDQSELEICAIRLYDAPDTFATWVAVREGPGSDATISYQERLPRVGAPAIEESVAMYESDRNEYTVVNEGAGARAFMQLLKEHAPDLYEKRYRSLEGVDELPSQKWFCADFSGGSLLIVTTERPDAETLDLLRRSASVFDLAYRRFRDLQKAEEDNRRIVEEKERAERALADLRATQAQLVEQEKLASLGALTAGIAHEIKNPLNFVNNFAEVNAELADELAEAVTKGDADEATAILADLRNNAAQIAKHGRRADSIVRSMMQHARGGTSVKETIDVNSFLEEYAALAWHGMRARMEDFQAEVVREFADDAGTIDAMPQELGRVILNLLNNAFDAVKGTEGAEVTIASRRTDDGVEITVSDNGPGVPPEIREKIFEPFFTTKPTGEGTGLGLSLSYDIVTKGHGGAMEVGAPAEGGAEFRVRLPVETT